MENNLLKKTKVQFFFSSSIQVIKLMYSPVVSIFF
jgi:hypothetical protein